MQKALNVEISGSLQDLFQFAETREEIRRKKEAGWAAPWTDDVILRDSRMNNIFREDDTVSKVIHNAISETSTLEDAWKTIFMGRFINRADRLKELYPVQDSLIGQMESLWTEETPKFNAYAYQIHPRIGGKFNAKGAKELLKKADEIVEATMPAIQGYHKSVLETANDINERLGGWAIFMSYQMTLDICQLRPNRVCPDSEIYTGNGAEAIHKSLGYNAYEIAEAQPTMWPQAKRRMHAFDAENLMCEYRKYKTRQVTGIPSNRKRKDAQYAFSL